MVDGLLKVALAGTGRIGGALPEGATPADALVPAEDGHPVERRVLLTAGARATYRQAGVSARAVPAAAAAADDPTPPCSARAGRLIATLLAGEQADLLPEALARLRSAGLRLPHALLPGALEAGARKGELRPALLATIGERGRWLAGQHQPWRWATARPLADEGAPPADAEALWEEGLPSERLAILRLLRAHDPARAREWLEAAWKGEKAEFRGEAIAACERGLSLADEPFLEAALDDRSQVVRAEAAKLLARLPESALARRLRDQSNRFLTFTPGLLAGGWRAAAKALVKGSSGGKLTVTPPLAYDKTWARDGIAEKPPHGTGERAWWLQQFLGLVQPSHWSEQFASDPTTMIAAAEGSDWAAQTLGGWSQAAILHRDQRWAAALWRYLSEAKIDRTRQHETGRLMGECAMLVPQAEAEHLVLSALSRASALDERLVPTLQRLPRPWSAAFASAVLRRFRARLQELGQQGSGFHYGESWLTVGTAIATALPPACFGQALDIETVAGRDTSPANGEWWKRRVADFADIVRTRQRLMEEIPL